MANDEKLWLLTVIAVGVFVLGIGGILWLSISISRSRWEYDRDICERTLAHAQTHGDTLTVLAGRNDCVRFLP